LYIFCPGALVVETVVRVVEEMLVEVVMDAEDDAREELLFEL
jgi:hypothetical protein